MILPVNLTRTLSQRSYQALIRYLLGPRPPITPIHYFLLYRNVSSQPLSEASEALQHVNEAEKQEVEVEKPVLKGTPPKLDREKVIIIIIKLILNWLKMKFYKICPRSFYLIIGEIISKFAPIITN